MTKLIIILMMCFSFLAIAEQGETDDRQPDTAAHQTHQDVEQNQNADMHFKEHTAKQMHDNDMPYRADHSGLDPRY